MIRKLRIKFVVVIMSIVTIMLASMLLLLNNITRENIERESMNMLRSMALNPRPPDRPDRRNEKDELRLPFFTIREDKKGGILETVGGYYDLSDEDMIRKLSDYVNSSNVESGIIQEYGLRYIRIEHPEGVTIVFSDTSSSESAMRAIRRNSIKIGVVTYLGFLVISILLAHMVVKPVEKAFNSQKQFVNDASHELKTPLTVILTNTEMLSSANYSEKQKARCIENIHVMAIQMRGLVESLLSLTRIDTSMASLQMQELDFSDLAENTALPFEPVFFEKGLSVAAELERGIRVKGDADKLRQVVEILLDNAQKYCADGTETVMTLTRIQKKCLLSVATRGEPLTKAQQKDVFLRFYRADQARSMNHSYGLGLSIAESIVNLHGGQIWVESADGWNTFYVQLPAV